MRISAYSGAGILFWYRAPTGIPHVLLGQRRAGWRWWDVPAGRVSCRDAGDLFACAERETQEEFGWPSATPGLADTPRHHLCSCNYTLPGYRWTTYLVQLASKPEACDFPKVRARDYHREFLQHRWFQARFGKLPIHLHPLLYPVLIHLRLRANSP